MKRSIHARRMERHHRRNKAQPKLNLVSLMDIFTILVFFLLVNSSDVEVLQSNNAIRLPESAAEKKPESTLLLMVSQDDIVLGGRPVISVERALKGNDTSIPELEKELKYQASRKPFSTDAQREQGRDITIMGDAEIPYTLLKKIMTTCAKTEYRNISLAVSRQESEAENSVEGS